MPQPKNQLLRVLVPVIILVLGLVLVVPAVLKNSSAPSTPTAAQTPNAAPPAAAPEAAPKTTAEVPAPVAPQPTSPQPSTTSEQPAATTPTPPVAAPAAPAAPTSTIVYRIEPVTPAVSIPSLGGLDPAGPHRLQVDFSPYGAGIKQLQLADHFETIWREHHVTVQSEHSYAPAGSAPFVMVPFYALAIEITPQGGLPTVVPIAGSDAWAPISGRPGAFEAHITDGNGQRALRLERVYILPEGQTELTLSQRIVNLSTTPLTVRWYQTGPIDLPRDTAGYGGDKRRVRFGYLFDKSRDPNQTQVMSDKFLMERHEALGKPQEEKSLWPNEKSIEGQYSLVWTGMSNRYFGVAAFPVVDPRVTASRAFPWVQGVDRIVLDPLGETMALRLNSVPIQLTAAGVKGDAADLSHMVFAGALNRRDLREDPITSAAGLPGLVVYNFGGMCANCTFEFMSNLLLWILHSLHNFVFHDWALAIVFLVLIVRSCLHPVTRWSQIRMARFGKQMGAVGPKQKILQEKYKNEPKKLQEETAKLWREEGISPTGMLGCIPMVLQMPVWIALYAVLYFSVELRHAGAFYGVFQKIQPATSMFWQFLGDLAEPDRLLYFKSTWNVPLIGSIIGPIHSLNILPLILGVVFFIQQKYLTPPTSATLTPEQEFQQKLMKWMTVLLFPIMMYNAPSGLAIYFICNSVFAIIESRWIRSHMDKHGMLDLDKMRAQRVAAGVGTSMWDRKDKKAPVKEGFLARLQRMAEEKQKEAMKAAAQKGKHKKK